MKRSLPALVVLAVLVIAVWSRSGAPSQPVQSLSLFALGTLVSVQLADPTTPEQLAELQTLLSERLGEFETQWSVRREGALSAVNEALSQSATAPLPAKLQEDFILARSWCQASQGTFDPAVGRLVALWGFEDDSEARSTPPTADELKAVPRASWCDAEINEQGVRLSRPGIQLNFGAMAKGRAVGLLTELLRAQGFKNFIVNAGGDLQVAGEHPARPWRIGVRDPRHADPQQAIAAIELRDGEALFSSGDYERFFEYQGQRYHHLIDPSTGEPARRAMSATILHHDPALADAASTALFVLGPDRAAEAMSALGIKHWMLLDPAGAVHGSAALRERLDWLGDAAR